MHGFNAEYSRSLVKTEEYSKEQQGGRKLLCINFFVSLFVSVFVVVVNSDGRFDFLKFVIEPALIVSY